MHFSSFFYCRGKNVGSEDEHQAGKKANQYTPRLELIVCASEKNGVRLLWDRSKG